MSHKKLVRNIYIILSLLAFQIILWYEVGKFKANATCPLTGYMLANSRNYL